MAIEEFQGEHRFLSNMWVVEHGIETPDGVVVDTVEHGYVAAKFPERDMRDMVYAQETGVDAKRVGRRLEAAGYLDPEWDERKIEVMTSLVRLKFAEGTPLAAQLVATGTETLIEGNNWGDRFWGVCPPGSGNGENNLGRILSMVRAELQGVMP